MTIDPIVRSGPISVISLNKFDAGCAVSICETGTPPVWGVSLLIYSGLNKIMVKMLAMIP